MSKDILYYPTIEFRQEDFRWLWISSLLWDKIYRIVPDGYVLNEARNIEELCSTGEIGIPLAPNEYSEEISREFMDKIEQGMWNAAALEFNHEDIEKYNEYTRLHKDKVDVALRNIMLLNDDILEDEEWLYVPHEMANIYMTYLANYIACENNLSLNTHNQNLWTASTFFQHDTSIQDGIFIGDDYMEPSNEVLASILIKDVIPQNIMGVSAKELLRFRDRRKDERKEFLRTFEEFSDKLTAVRDRRIIEQLIHEERSKVEKALEEYKRSMDIIRATRWTGSLTSFITLAVDAIGYLAPEATFIKPLTSAGIGLGLLTGLIGKKVQLEQNPYSYLTSFSFLTQYDFEKYNYRLYRKIEEFIND